MKKSTKILRIILQVLVSAAFLGGAYSKLSGNAMEVDMFTSLHINNTLMIIGVLEVLVPVLLWFRKTRTFAVLLASAIMGGAVAESISFGGMMAAIAPAIVLVLAWLVIWLDCECGCACEGCKDCAVKNETVAPAPVAVPTVPMQ